MRPSRSTSRTASKKFLRCSVKIKLLHVIATLDPAGAENQLTRLVLNLDNTRFCSFVCCLTRGGAPLEAKLAAGGIPFCILHKRGKLDPLALLKLLRIIRRYRPHVAHTWLFTSNAYGRLAAVLGDVPIRIATELSVDAWKWGPYRLVDSFLVRFTDAVIVNADAVKRFYVEQQGVPASKVVLIRNGIDLNVFQPRPRDVARQRFGIPQGAMLIGGAGRLDPQKGFPILVEAMSEVQKKCPQAMLVIAGAGPQRDALEAQAYKLGERFRLLGYVEDIPTFMSALDIFVLPSLWEGLPHVVMEAMACGCPVVAAHIGGVGELIQDGVTGRLVVPRSPSALAEAIIQLLQSPDLRAEMGRKARLVAQREFDFMLMVRQTEELYLRLAEKHKLWEKSF